MAQERRTTQSSDRFDFVIIGAGPAGEAAAYKARERGASVAIVDGDLFGGSCPHWGCIPSKSLLNAAARHAAGADYPWSRASARRDYMINRVDLDYPDDSGHVRGLEDAGAKAIRGRARIDGPGRVVVEPAGEPGGGGRGTPGDGGREEPAGGNGRTAAKPGPGGKPGAKTVLHATNIVVAVGSQTKVPPVKGIETVRAWTNREATGARELPQSLLVLGGGPTGLELAQVYARFGVPTSIVQSGNRLLPRDHPRNAEAAKQAVERDGVKVRLGVRALQARAGAGADGADVIDLDDGSTAEGHAILLAVGRTFPLGGLGLETVGIDPNDRAALVPDGRLRIADGLYLIGDPAGPELHTHQGHYQGEIAVRMALGEAIVPDYRALPRATYIDPELAFVGLSLEQAIERDLDAFELVADFATTAKGYSVEAEFGHVTIVVDRTSHQLVGAAMATPDASAAIHECVLAIKARVPVETLAETIHAFPSTSRIFNGLFADAARRLAKGD